MLSESSAILFQLPAVGTVAEPLFDKDSQIKLVDDIIYILVQVSRQSCSCFQPVFSESCKVEEVYHTVVVDIGGGDVGVENVQTSPVVCPQSLIESIRHMYTVPAAIVPGSKVVVV